MTISEKSRILYDLMIEKGYPEDFAGLIASEMHTDFTATRMIGYIARSGRVPLEEAADEMLAILSGILVPVVGIGTINISVL